jgi:hypothetical protein
MILHLPDFYGILSQIFSNFKEVETWDVLWSVQYCHASIIIDQNYQNKLVLCSSGLSPGLVWGPVGVGGEVWQITVHTIIGGHH